MKKKIFAISDVHGHYDEMITCLNEAGYDENNPDHLLISLGDAFDRGPCSLEIYKYFKRLSDEKKAIILRGNHTTMFIDYLEGNIDPFNYFRNGERETFASFLQRTAPFESWCYIDKNMTTFSYGDFGVWVEIARKQIKKEYPDLLQWLKERPYYYETENYIFTHGAIDTIVYDWHKPRRQLYHFKGWEALTWNNGSFFKEEINNTDKTIVIGHFGTSHLRKKYNLGDSKDYSILRRDDGRVIAIDTTTIISKKVNVLVIDDEEIIEQWAGESLEEE